ncbi:hypothetical protein LPC08_24785 (plasmid) [Roseomonas sp. OT10]|uniref:hypothetical protein n=1 Tax=Roseomonas cutis TaxID=2897332 RepID=UPI001E40C861|nr:hypothetical protein [Roseomonas sp. OT10]UFN51734.1 hypothetical protein LPC08_24785 [Roseomonas sp. OT10]
MRSRDAQRARVYTWEEEAVTPYGQAPLPFAAAQGMVDAIWAEMGLRWPPRVEPLPRQARRLQGTGSRLVLRLPDPVPSFLLLHELAHALSSTADDETDAHGPRFVGLYLQLLTRYLRLGQEELLRTVKAHGIEVELSAKPVFVDAR